MNPEIGILHQLSVNRIYTVTTPTQTDLKAWLANGQYLLAQPLSSNSNSRATDFKLRVNYIDYYYASLANDCNRFSQAAIETMWSVGEVPRLPKSAGWATIKMYYSAFFAAHAILRLYGRSCTQLSAEHVEKVHEIATATNYAGNATNIESGFYSSSFSTNEVGFRKIKDSHADTWASFYDLLSWIIQEIGSTTGRGIHKADAMTLLENIKSGITQSGATRGNWMSQIRNKINYQHSNGVWHPYVGVLHDNVMMSKNSEWLKGPTRFEIRQGQSEVSAMFNVSNTILSLMYQLIKFGYERSGKKSVSLKNGTFRLLNQIHAV